MSGHLHLLSAGAARGLAQDIRASFEATHGVNVAATFGAAGAMRERLEGGAACDVVVLPAAMIDTLVAAGHVAEGTAAPLGAVHTGVAVRERDPRPDVGNAQNLADALRAAHGIYFPDPALATAGIHFMSVVERLGVASRVSAALRPYPNGAAAMAAMAAATEAVVLGCTQVTEIRYTAGVALVGPLPDGLGLATSYVAAVSARSKAPALARTYVASLTGDSAAALRAAGGFER